LEVAMLAELRPRTYARYTSLRLLGCHVEDFVAWLQAQGYPPLPIRLRLRALTRLDARLRRRGVRRMADLRLAQLLDLAPRDSQDDLYMSALVRTLARYFDARGVLTPPARSPREQVVAAYRAYLDRVRGLADSTLTQHSATAGDLLSFLEFDRDPAGLRTLGPRQIEAFLRAAGPRLCRASLQHMVAHLRSFLRFLASRGDVVHGLDSSIDTPRLYRGEQLPRALAWETVQAFLAAIDRSTPKGKRDYAMFLLIATYGLRTSEIAALRLDDLEWRAGRIRIPRPKAQTPLILPLTEEVGAALIDYLRHARPHLPYRHVFLRVRAPGGPLGPTAVSEV
jgi:site-specific recombinase XerD